MQLKGFSEWEPRTQAIVSLVGGVVFLVMFTAFVRRVGWPVIFVPVLLIGILYLMNKNAGCMESATKPGDARGGDALIEESGAAKPGVKRPGSGSSR